VVRRVHRKAPTTTTMMVNAPTDTMMTITRMWLSPVPDMSGFPESWNVVTMLQGKENVSRQTVALSNSCLRVFKGFNVYDRTT